MHIYKITFKGFLILCLFSGLSNVLAAEYTVKPGDTLPGIARQHLDSTSAGNDREISRYINQIILLNSDSFTPGNADQLSVGMQLTLPEVYSRAAFSVRFEDALADSANLIVARVSAITGSGWIIHSDESRDSIRTGLAIREGDTIETEPGSVAIIQFIDQSTLIIKSSSEMTVEEFSWNAQSASGRAIFDFTRGLFRAVSGLLGKSEPLNTTVKTPVANIGIRGTDYGARYCQQVTCELYSGDNKLTLSKGLYLGVLDGQVSAVSQGSDTLLSAGEAIYQKNANSNAQKIKNLPGLIFSANELSLYSIHSASKETLDETKPTPFYQAFIRNSHGDFIRDRYGNCIRSQQFQPGHQVEECQ